MSIVELHLAYVWDCESCGRENFQRSISSRLDPDDEADAETIRDLYDLEPDEPIPARALKTTWQQHPDRVTCRHCGAEFKAVDGWRREEE